MESAGRPAPLWSHTHTECTLHTRSHFFILYLVVNGNISKQKPVSGEVGESVSCNLLLLLSSSFSLCMASGLLEGRKGRKQLFLSNARRLVCIDRWDSVAENNGMVKAERRARKMVRNKKRATNTNVDTHTHTQTDVPSYFSVCALLCILVLP